VATLLRKQAVVGAGHGGVEAGGVEGLGGARPLFGAASGLKAAFGGKSLRDVLGLPGSGQVRLTPWRVLIILASTIIFRF
jgi:hypothetical protein